MARFMYVCDPKDSGCGNEVPAERIDKRIAGSKGQARITFAPVCECKAGNEMKRVEYTPARREVSHR